MVSLYEDWRKPKQPKVRWSKVTESIPKDCERIHYTERNLAKAVKRSRQRVFEVMVNLYEAEVVKDSGRKLPKEPQRIATFRVFITLNAI